MRESLECIFAMTLYGPSLWESGHFFSQSIQGMKTGSGLNWHKVCDFTLDGALIVQPLVFCIG